MGEVRRAKPNGPAMSVTFTLDGQEYFALNGGPHYQLSPAFSMYVDCKDQKEVDELYSKLLSGGGKEEACGWIRDRFGLSWQIIPTVLPQLLYHKDPATAKRVFDAMMKMKKIIIADLEKARDGK